MAIPRSRKRLISLITIAVVLLIAAIGYQRYYVARPMGSGPAGPTVDRTPFENIWSDQKVHVIGIGDSVTAGLGARSPSHSYFNRVLKNPSDEFESLDGICLTSVLPNLTSENHAISGSESPVHLDVIRENVPEQELDVFGIVLMTSGGNDLIHMYGKSPPRECAMYGATLEQAIPWIDSFESRMRTMLSEINDRFPGGCEIYLGDIYDPTDGSGDAGSIYLSRWSDGLEIHRRYNAAIRKVADERDNVFVVPLYETFLGHGSQCRKFWRSTYCAGDPHFWFYSNIEDPNDRGYDAIRRVFLNTIADHTSLRPR